MDEQGNTRDKNKLVGDQWLKPEDVRQIVVEEQIRLVEILKMEVLNTPARADGNLNAGDFGQTLDIVQTGLKSRLIV